MSIENELNRIISAKEAIEESMIVEGKITPLTKEDNEPGYDFKFVEEKAL